MTFLTSQIKDCVAAVSLGSANFGTKTHIRKSTSWHVFYDLSDRVNPVDQKTYTVRCSVRAREGVLKYRPVFGWFGKTLTYSQPQFWGRQGNFGGKQIGGSSSRHPWLRDLCGKVTEKNNNSRNFWDSVKIVLNWKASSHTELIASSLKADRSLYLACVVVTKLLDFLAPFRLRYSDIALNSVSAALVRSINLKRW